LHLLAFAHIIAFPEHNIFWLSLLIDVDLLTDLFCWKYHWIPTILRSGIQNLFGLLYGM